jgi:hypothetical protein
MKTTSILYPVFICSCFLTSCSHSLAPEGHYQQDPVIADGNTSDWQLPLRFSNEQYTIQYAVTNDNNNLYLCILSKDQPTQLRILKAGINVYFDPKGEKNKKIDIAFPIKKPDQFSEHRYGDPIPAVDPKETMAQQLLQSDYYNIAGFTNIENGQYAVKDKKSNIQVALKLNPDSSLVYEAIVPIMDILGLPLDGKNASKNFSVGIVINNLSYRNNTSRPSYGGGGMRGGMRGGGMGGGGRRNYGNEPAAKEDASWYSFRLAYKKN